MSLVGRLLGRKVADATSGDPGKRPHSGGDVDVQAILRQAVALSGERRFTEIHRLIDHALAETPDHPDLLFAKGGALVDMGRFADARVVYESLQRGGHASVAVEVQLAVACHRSGDLVAAENALQRAIVTDPLAYRPRYALGTLLLLQNRFEQAIPHLQAAIAADPQSADARLA